MITENIIERVTKFQEVLKAFPEFKYLGDPILRTPTQPVELEEGFIIGKKLGEILINYRKLTGIGRGLAAPQIGIARSVFTTYLDDKIQIYINPKIVSSSNKSNLYRELCLSSGIMWADVERPVSIKIEWINELGVKEDKVFDSFMARTIEIQLSDPLQEKIREK